MAALMLAVPGLEVHWGFLIVALAVAAGGLLDITRVAKQLGKKVTGMNPGQGFAASLVTAGLVTTASLHSLPVSTTHVSVGALFGMGAASRRVHWRKVARDPARLGNYCALRCHSWRGCGVCVRHPVLTRH